MLDRGKHSVGRGKIVALIAFDPGLGHAAAEIDVLARAFRYPAPARIAGDVDHGGKGPVDTFGARFLRGDAGGFLHRVHVPACRLAQRDWEDGAVTVDHVVTEHQRNLQPRVLDCELLQFAGVTGGIGVEDIADLTGADILLIAVAHGRAGRFPVARQQRELTDLFLQRHLADQLVEEPVHLLIARGPGGLRGPDRDRAGGSGGGDWRGAFDGGRLRRRASRRRQ